MSVPLKSEVGRLFQFDPGNNLLPDSALPADLDPFGRTTGLGDIAYLGLVGPKHLPKVGEGKLFLAAGTTLIFPSASEDILGQGKWQAGTALAAGFLSDRWHLGVFLQQWWSFAGDVYRGSVSQMILQYFLYYAPTPELEIGMSPNAFANWNAPSGNQVVFPVGLGVQRLLSIGPLPVNLGFEVGYSVIHPSDLPGSRWGIRFTIISSSHIRFMIVTGALLAGFQRIGIYDKHVHLDVDLSLPPSVMCRTFTLSKEQENGPQLPRLQVFPRP